MTTPADIAAKEAQRRITWTLHRAEMAVQSAKEPGFRRAGVPRAQYGLLMHIFSFPGNSGAELARRMGVTTQAVAGLTSKLQERGLIERRQHPRHINVRELHLTPAGLNVLSVAEEVVVGVEHDVQVILGPTKAEQLRILLEQIITELHRGSDQSS